LSAGLEIRKLTDLFCGTNNPNPVPLPEPPLHIGFSNDGSYLAVLSEANLYSFRLSQLLEKVFTSFSCILFSLWVLTTHLPSTKETESRYPTPLPAKPDFAQLHPSKPIVLTQSNKGGVNFYDLSTGSPISNLPKEYFCGLFFFFSSFSEAPCC